MSLTIDRNDPGLNKPKKNGQNETYLVLSEEERKKGFIRPYRDRYVHKGRFYKYHEEIEMLDEVYESSNGKSYIALVPALKEEDGTIEGKAYLNEEEINEIKKTGGYAGGCGSSTKMHPSISETYARDPNFYGSTFCMGCGTHIDVGEFVWEGTDEKVGS